MGTKPKAFLRTIVGTSLALIDHVLNFQRHIYNVGSWLEIVKLQNQNMKSNIPMQILYLMKLFKKQ